MPNDSKTDQAPPGSVQPAGSANWRDDCATARKERLNRGLRTLASWAQSRAMGEHDDETTLTMLERKAAELRDAVNKAGWDAVAAAHSTNSIY
jgi:hypothetical protein